MNTLRLNAREPSKAQNAVERAGEILKNGGLVAIPTETVYGLGANALNEQAVRNIFKAKGRPCDNPLIVHISRMEMLNPLVSEIPPTASRCAERFWPGPFTMVLPKSDIIPDAVSAGLETVAVRMPAEKVTRDIIDAAGVPIAAPSANLSGLPSPTTAEHCLNDLDGIVDAVVLGNDCAVGVESTVVSFAVSPPRLLRPGGVTPEQLRELIPDLVIDKAVLSEPEKGEKVASPGMKYKHYSPKAHVIMVEGSREKFVEFVNKNIGDGVYALCYNQDAKLLKVPALPVGDDDRACAEHIFAALRELDEKGCRLCYAIAPPKSGVGLAVYNRLIRAAGFEVIKL